MIRENNVKGGTTYNKRYMSFNSGGENMRMSMFLLLGLLCWSCANRENIPKNILEIFEDDRGNKLYLIEASLIGSQGYPPFNNESVIDKSYFISYKIAGGNYPESYSSIPGYIHVIPEGNSYVLELYFENISYYENNRYIGSTLAAFSHTKPSDTVYYSPEILYEKKEFGPTELGVKAFEYYLKNNKNIRKVRRPTLDLTSEDFRKMQQ
jgi:hypothetical protein